MAPVGSYESLMAAVAAGADSVYFGVGQLNMRSRSAASTTSRASWRQPGSTVSRPI